MKQIGLFVFIGLIVLNLITYKSCKSYKTKHKESEKEYLALNNTLDSLLALPPDTVKSEPVIIKEDSLVYITRWIKEPNKGDTENTYTDSLKNDSIDVKVTIKAKDLYSIDYAYRPIYKYQTLTVTKNVPYPVVKTKIKEVQIRGFYLDAGLGYSDSFVGKLGITYLDRKNNSYSGDIVRYGDNNIYIISYGVRL